MPVTMVILLILISIVILFHFIGSAYVVKKYDGFRVFYNEVNRLFDYKGRTDRITYACFALLVGSIDIIIDGVFSLLDNPPLIFEYIIDFIFIFASLAITARRLHDLGYSGWLQVPIVLISTYHHNMDSEKFSNGGLITLIFVLFGFQLFLMFKEGQNSSNKYGEKPIELTHNQ